MHFAFALDSSDMDLLNIDLLDQRYTHLDLLDTYISGKHFLFLQDVLKTSSSRLEDVSKTYFEDVFKTSSRPANVCRRIKSLNIKFFKYQNKHFAKFNEKYSSLEFNNISG